MCQISFKTHKLRKELYQNWIAAYLNSVQKDARGREIKIIITIVRAMSPLTPLLKTKISIMVLKLGISQENIIFNVTDKCNVTCNRCYSMSRPLAACSINVDDDYSTLNMTDAYNDGNAVQQTPAPCLCFPWVNVRMCFQANVLPFSRIWSLWHYHTTIKLSLARGAIPLSSSGSHLYINVVLKAAIHIIF